MTKENFYVMRSAPSEYNTDNLKEKVKERRTDSYERSKRIPLSERRSWCLTVFVLLLFILSLALLITSFHKISSAKHEQKRLKDKLVEYEALVRKLQGSINKTRGQVISKLSELEVNITDIIKNSSHFQNAIQMRFEQSQKNITELLNKSTEAWAALQSVFSNQANSSGYSYHFCPQGWHREFTDSCYYLSTHQRNWNSSKMYCESQQAHLVIIEDRKEQDFIYKWVSNKEVWLGFNDLETEGTWVWVDGLPRNEVMFWNEGEPNNNEGKEDCGSMWPKSATWNDLPCTLQKDFVCEKKAAAFSCAFQNV
ncbi:C-type lectin domain family 4 member G-like isoform X2 [Erpetoichthys calabaricus]|uniref:C-type lectin domain family 4 member G-like isoform X2 n=1 Tax=Erpetoichthys calabaricus TaxID=27687 RepID=UPI0022349362|nr:C-type lectin domain family 4 member G-like isoform X2 [Erpetoichthys calabaricus]